MIDQNMIKEFKSSFEANPAHQASASAVARVGIYEASVATKALRRHNHQFSDTTKRGDITEQKQSGRCWMFAALNTARVETIKKYNMKSLEFSQVYTLFWDKLERANYFFDSIIETMNQELGSRVVHHLLIDPLCDGGQWDMFKSILDKYGIVPKDHMPETFNSSNTRALDDILTSMLRRFTVDLRATKNAEDAKVLKKDMLQKIYNVLVKALGPVPEVVNFEYVDKDEKYHRLPEMTPQDFFKEVVGWNLKDKISVINAPTKDKPYGRVCTVKHLGTISEAEPIKHLNVPIEVLKEATIKAIKEGNPVWFGCDVGQRSERSGGIMDLDMYDYAATLGYDPDWTKEQRLDYGESLLTHAMVFTGVNLDKDGKPINWQVENSWGDKPGKKGMYSMSDEWFDEFVYQIMTDKKYIDKKWLAGFAQEPIELAPWDPMGALA